MLLRILVLALSMLGCSVDLTVDQEAIISCTGPGECPEGYVCNDSSGRCVLAAARDAVSPQLVGAPLLAPAIARESGSVSLSFTVDEPLLTDPVVTFVNRGLSRSFELSSSDGAAQPSYVYTYEVRGDEDEVSAPLNARLVDRAGNTTDGEIGVAIAFDRTPPTVGAATLRLFPVSTSLLTEVEAAGRGTGVEITFAVDEPLEGPPVLSALAADLGFVCTGDETVYVCLGAVPATGAVTDGPTTVTATLTDLAGNVATPELAFAASTWPQGLVIDTVAPDAPAVAAARSITFRRLPWGTATSGGARQMTVRGLCADTASSRPVATEASSWVFAFDDVDPTSAALLGSTRADAGGSFGLDGTDATACGAADQVFALNPLDLPTVYLVAVDAAGNASDADPSTAGVQAAAVRDVEWTATLVGKTPGTELGNPHEFEAWRWFAPQRQAANSLLYGDGDGLAEIGGARVETSGAGRWQNATCNLEGMPFLQSGIPTVDTTITYDPRRGRLVQFGGYSPCYCGGLCGITVERAEVRWTVVHPRDPEGDGNPDGRREAALAFDPREDVSLLFGGDGAAGFLDDTWSWDGNSWRKLCAGCGPAARAGHSLVADPVTGSVLLFGGETEGGVDNDMWQWRAGSWQPLCTDATCIATRPSARRDHAMIYDTDQDVFLLFGGSTGGDELWQWDREIWTPLCTDEPCRADAPPATTDPGFVMAGVPTLVGGEHEGVTYDCSDVPIGIWEWHGDSWHSVSYADPSPRARYGHALAYVPDRNRIVMVGGQMPWGCVMNPNCDAIDILEAWEWDGAGWRFVWVDDPGYLEGSAATWDPGRGAVVLHGGVAGGPGYTPYLSRYMWVWSGAGWRYERTIGGPVARAFHGLAALPGTGELLVYGGSDDIGGNSAVDDDLWAWNGSDWASLCGTGCTKPGPAVTGRMFATEQGVVYLGQLGASPSETWLWFAGAWTTPCGSATCSGDPSTGSRAAAVDPTGTIWLVGGGNGFDTPDNEVWSYASGVWQLVLPGSAAAPEGRYGAMTAWDAARGRLVLFGGTANNPATGSPELCANGAFFCGGVWLFDGATWTEARVADPLDDGAPLPRMNAAFAYDPERDVAVMHGGYDNAGRRNETWLWHGGGTERPAHVIHTRLDVASIDQSSTLLDVEVRWRGGGSGDDGGVVDGASMFIWDVDRWRDLTTLDAPADSPGDATWRAADDATLGSLMGTERAHRLATGPTRTLHFALAPAAPNGTLAEYATVTTDYVEVTVRYRR